MGDPVSVECRATGRPRPKLTWKRQGSTLQLVTSEANDVNTIRVNYEHLLKLYFDVNDAEQKLIFISFLSGLQFIQRTQGFTFARV